MKTDPEQIAQLSAFQDLLARDVPRHLIDGADNAVVVVDIATHRIVSLNPSGQILFDVSLRDVRQMTVIDLFSGHDPDRVTALIDRFVQSRHMQLRFSVKPPSTQGFGHDVIVQKIVSDRPTLTLVIEDPEHKNRAFEAASLAKEQLRSAIEALHDGFALYDSNDRLSICNDRYRQLYQRSIPAIKPGALFADIIRYGLEHGQYPDAVGREEDWLAERLAAHERSNHTIEQKLEDGRWLRIHEHRTACGGRVGLRVDITDLKRQKERLGEIVRTDELTGLLNRRGLRSDLTKLLANGEDGAQLSVFHINLNRFRLVNEVHGSDIGDAVLRCAADRLRRRIGPDDLLARIGADEFVVVVVGQVEDFDAQAAARDLVDCVSEPKTFGQKSVTVGCNVGIVCYEPGQCETDLGLLAAASLALSAAKAVGRDEVKVFHQDMRKRATLENEMALEIQLGLTRGEVLPHFQPQVDTATGRVIGFESLVRWDHPVRGLVPAFQFLSIAQRAGLTEAIDDLMMDRSCAGVRQLLDWGKSDACVSINVSAPQISDPNIVRRLTGHLEAYGLSPSHIHVELLESTLLDDRTSQIIHNVRSLIDAGFAIELDDFGTGHAAIATLRRFPVSRIKIDRSLVQHIDSDSELQLITSAVINLAEDLGIDALAEGVETRAEQQLLRRIGCKCAQGYLHAKPMPLLDLRRFLDDRGELL